MPVQLLEECFYKSSDDVVEFAAHVANKPTEENYLNVRILRVVFSDQATDRQKRFYKEGAVIRIKKNKLQF